MKTATLASAAAFLAASNAASVTLQTTKCLDSSIPYGQQFDIELNTAQPVAKDLLSVCGLSIIAVSDAVDIHTVQCQAFRDAAGTRPGSAVFTYDSPALIATNPVQEKAIRCSVVPSFEKRQAANATISSTPASRTQSEASISASASASGSLSSSESSALSTLTSSRRVITSTVVVGPSSGLPSSSVNGTISSVTPRPTPSSVSSASPSSTGAAGQVGVGVGVVAGAMLAMFV